MTFFISFIFIIVILNLIFDKDASYGCLGFIVIILIGLMALSYNQKKSQERYEEWLDEEISPGVTNGAYASCVAEEERTGIYSYCDP